MVTGMKKTFGITQYGTIDMYIHNNSFFERKPIIDDRNVTISGMNVAILDFDLKCLKGKKIESATLKLKVASEDYPLQVEITSISHPWDGASASYYYCRDAMPWAAGGWFSDCIMGNGNSEYSLQDTIFDPGTGILSVNIPVSLVYSIINEQSYGLGILDYKSKLYREEPGKKSLAVKLFNVNPDFGPVPELEVTYEEGSFKTPPAPYNFKGGGLPNPESFDTARALLSWSVVGDDSDEYRYYRLYYSEDKRPVEEMTPVPRYMVPIFRKGERNATAEISGLKPDTGYWFALVLANNALETKPVYTWIRTLPAAQRPDFARECKPCPEHNSQGCGTEGKMRTGQNLPAGLHSDAFSVYFTDEVTKVNPVTGSVFEADPRGYAQNAADAVVSKFHCRWFDGEGLCLTAVPGEKLAFQLVAEQKIADDGVYTIKTKNDTGISVELYKLWYLKVGEAWFPDAAVPLQDSFCIPFEENGIDGQKFQAVLADIHVPETIQAGDHNFEISVEHEGRTVNVPIRIRVEAVELETPEFIFELNGYAAVPVYMGRQYGDPDFSKIEQEYYKAAARHYMTINIVPYSHFGTVMAGCTPRIEMVDGVPRVVDWSEWDAHFEKYLDGSYIEEEMERKVPVTHMYLPIFENWPMPINEYYRVKVESDEYPQNVNEHMIKSTSIEEDFLPGYREGIKAILKDFIRHIDEKGWKNVQFQYFFNNKQFYKEKQAPKKSGATGSAAWLMNRTCGNDGRATSWWLLDEPFFRYDWKALAYFGSILREAQAEMNSGYNIKFRADLSRYNLMYDTLDNILDVAVISGRVFETREDIMRQREEKFNETNWVYGSLNPIGSSNLDTLFWVVDTYLKGGKGLVPWNNYARDDSYEIPTDTAGFYPGNRFGLDRPVLSMRLKSARKALQLLRYLETFKKAMGFSNIQLKAYVSQFLTLRSSTVSRFSEDAGLVRYAGGTYDDIEALRLDLIRRLSAMRNKA